MYSSMIFDMFVGSNVKYSTHVSKSHIIGNGKFKDMYWADIEFLQEKYTKNRAFDWYDIVANALGAVTSFILVKSYHVIQNKNISH